MKTCGCCIYISLEYILIYVDAAVFFHIRRLIMAFISLFEVIGPNMVGPSSSHTAGAVRIGLVTRRLLGEKVKTARIGMYGSFAATGKGHGTDRALVAGLLGMEPDDIRIPDSFAQAEREKMEFQIGEISLSGAHPNTGQGITRHRQEYRREEVRCVPEQDPAKGAGITAVFF